MRYAADIDKTDASEAVVDGATSITVDLDTGLIIVTTDNADELFGYAVGELIGKHISVLIPDAKREAHASHFSENAKHPTARSMGQPGLELHGVTKQGAILPLEVGLSKAKMVGAYRSQTANIGLRTERQKGD